jgi:hypothetical protein
MLILRQGGSESCPFHANLFQARSGQLDWDRARWSKFLRKLLEFFDKDMLRFSKQVRFLSIIT